LRLLSVDGKLRLLSLLQMVLVLLLLLGGLLLSLRGRLGLYLRLSSL
jgi:hypothetical protein